MSDIRHVTPQEAALLNEQGALLLDVREDNEWERGRAATASHIALAELPDHVDELPKDRLDVCVCRSGGRSLRAAQFLAENGFDVANLEGGMTAWFEAGIPIIADDGEPVIG